MEQPGWVQYCISGIRGEKRLSEMRWRDGISWDRVREPSVIRTRFQPGSRRLEWRYEIAPDARRFVSRIAIFPLIEFEPGRSQIAPQMIPRIF